MVNRLILDEVCMISTAYIQYLVCSYLLGGLTLTLLGISQISGILGIL